MLRARRWAALAFALVLCNGYPVARTLLRNDAPPNTASRHFTVFHFNVGLHHVQPNRISSYLQRRANQIDVVVLLETGANFEPALDQLKEIFSYQIRHLEDSPFGIVMLSKYPIRFGAISYEPSRLFPHVEASIKLPGRDAPLALLAVHAPPPISADMADYRNRKLNHIAGKVAAQPQATPIVVGDFNLTPWSPYFKKFVADSGLSDARTPKRFEHTWPVTFDNANIGLAIDHSFAHSSLALLKRAVGPDLGSDHLPVTVTFAY